MTKVSDLRAKPLKMLWYGPAGSGKTALALTFGERCLYLDLDDNLEVAFGLKDDFQKDRLSVEVEQYLDDDDPTKAVAFARLKKRVMGLSAAIKRGGFPYDVVVLDSLTSVAAASQNATMYASSKLGVNPQIQHWGTRSRSLSQAKSCRVRSQGCSVRFGTSVPSPQAKAFRSCIFRPFPRPR
jgi:hypothetical protein